MMIRTTRLELRPCGLDHYAALRRGREALGELIHAWVPADWPTFADSFSPGEAALLRDPSRHEWSTWLAVHLRDQVLIGEGGYSGPPDTSGRLDVGLAIIPGYRGAGYATEFAAALLRRAFHDPRVNTIGAEIASSVDATAARRVVAKLGMLPVPSSEGERWVVSRMDFVALLSSNGRTVDGRR